MRLIRLWGVALAAAGLVSACGDYEGSSEDAAYGELGEAVVGAQETFARPEVAFLTIPEGIGGEPGGNCTATLISGVSFVTAAHCVGFATSRSIGTLTIHANSTMSRTETVDRVYSLGSHADAFDIAIGFLKTPLPTAWRWTTGLHYGAFPDALWTKLGYGCVARPRVEPFIKRFREASGTNTKFNCAGDSGGPLLAGGLFDWGGIARIISGFDGDGRDRDAPIDPVWIEGMHRRLSTPARGSGYEFGWDRRGFDYKNFANVDAGPCRDRCLADPKCQAFTTTFDGAGGSHCWLKSATPSADPDTAEMVSGVSEGYGFFDLPGGDVVNSPQPSVDDCETFCALNQFCVAYSYTNAGRCWIKDRVRPMVASSTVRSGTRRNFEAGIDRPGMDLRSLSTGSALDCAHACQAEKRCDAFSFAAGTCWLKQGLPAPRVDANVTSGLRRGIEFNSFRDGHVYRSFDLGNEPLRRCQTECYLDNFCKAWNADLPSGRAFDGNRTCSLLDSIGNARTASGSVSGRARMDFF